jgi:hypothetical protein
MKRMLSLLIVMLFAFPAGVMAGKTQCAKYHVRLEGISNLGSNSLQEIIEMHKVGQASGYNGKWQIDRITHINTHSHVIEPPIFEFPQKVNFGDGQYMNCRAFSNGNVITNICEGGNAYLDVVNNRVGKKNLGLWAGKITGKQMQYKIDPNNWNEPMLTGEIRKPGNTKLTLDIVFPVNQQFSFGDGSPGVLELDFEAKVTPAQYEQDVQWIVPEIKGSTLTVDPPNAKGSHIKVTYTGLPTDNNEFGAKTVEARVSLGGCQTQDLKFIKVFYLRDAMNNPEGKYPNWFYYYKQTPAAKPRGQLVNIEYGSNTFGLCTDPNVPAQYTPGYAHCTIHVCDLTKLGPEFRLRYPKLILSQPYFNGWAESTYIDTFAVAIIHEYTHWLVYHNYRHGKPPAQIAAEDTDKDGLPDKVEPGYNLDPGKYLTHLLGHPTLGTIEGDEEWLAYSSMSEIKIGTLDKYDWGRPGKNWP